MIVVDSRAGSAELAPLLENLGATVHLDTLNSGDFAFNGETAVGYGAVGVERKAVPDLLQCMTDGRYIQHQLVNMLNDYQEVWLMVEGIWWEHDDGTVSYKMKWQQRDTRIRFDALHKFLLSITRIAGVRIDYSTSHKMTARKVFDLYHHCQKDMAEHSTFQGFRTDATVVETLMTKKSLLTRWAKELPGVGWKKTKNFERVYSNAYELATSSARKMATVKGVSLPMAQKLYEEIRGIK